MGEIITFYSYKGGVGRTMTLANVAVLLAKWNYKVLMVDWDIEAPGLEYYFKDYVKLSTVQQKKGIVELLQNMDHISSYNKAAWKEYISIIKKIGAKYVLHLLTAGNRDDNYFSRVQAIDIENLYKNKDGGIHIELLREKWKSEYDFVLVDSRTGVTDFGGICTVQLPDILMLFFGANKQSLNGVVNIANNVLSARQKMPKERLLLTILPIASRFDSQEEFLISQEWLDIFAENLDNFYADWLPASIKSRDIIEITKIPYIPYFSFGEKLPVLEQGTNDPTSIGYAYENLSALIANKLEDIEQFYMNRDEYIARANKGNNVQFNKMNSNTKQSIGLYKNVFLDIETTGISPSDSQVAILGMHLSGDSSNFVQLIGKDINKEKIIELLKGVETIYTYNGHRFDIPFIKSTVGIDIEEQFNHVDLMYECWRRNLFGGLKAVELKLGIPRNTSDISILDVIQLWWDYKDNNNEQALNKLLEYNLEDLKNLKLLKDKLAELKEFPLSGEGEIEIIPLVGMEADKIDIASYVRQLKREEIPQDIRKIYRITESGLFSLFEDTVDTLNKIDTPQHVQLQEIIIEAEKIISGFEILTNNIEKFALASVQEGFNEGVNIILKFAGDWISISEKPMINGKTKFVQGAPELLAWRMLCLSGAKALEEEEFEILKTILSEPIEVEESSNIFTNIPLLKRHMLFHPKSMLNHADLAIDYISKLWNNKEHLHYYFTSNEEYSFSIAKFFILVSLISSPDKNGHRLYPGYRLLPQANRAMSSFCSKLSASNKYLHEIAFLIDESSQVFKEAWKERTTHINELTLGSRYITFNTVPFPESIDSDITDL